jgi:hypothetical protein
MQSIRWEKEGIAISTANWNAAVEIGRKSNAESCCFNDDALGGSLVISAVFDLAPARVNPVLTFA